MKINFDPTKNLCEIIKEPGDRRFYRSGWTCEAESTFLYRLMRLLKKQGYDVLKKRMWRDGHMVSDTQQYIRERRGAFCVYNADYALYDAGEEFNNLLEGESMFLRVEHDL